MSIIEKALNKLGPEAPESAPVANKGAAKSFPENDADKFHEPAETAEQESQSGPTQEPTAPPRQRSIDYAALSALGIITPELEDKARAEEYRRIKRPILVRAFESGNEHAPPPNLVLITSSVQGEGKTYTALNLAMSVVGEVDKTVLLIDGDAIQRRLSRQLGLGGEAGLTDYLTTTSGSVASYLWRTDLRNLRVIPAGREQGNLAELWSSQRMQELLDELAARYRDRLVIFDSPPLLQDASVGILAAKVGQVIVVVGAEKTPIHQVTDALRVIEGAAGVAFVLNKSNQRAFSGDYAYDYY